MVVTLETLLLTAPRTPAPVCKVGRWGLLSRILGELYRYKVTGTLRAVFMGGCWGFLLRTCTQTPLCKLKGNEVFLEYQPCAWAVRSKTIF